VEQTRRLREETSARANMARVSERRRADAAEERARDAEARAARAEERAKRAEAQLAEAELQRQRAEEWAQDRDRLIVQLRADISLCRQHLAFASRNARTTTRDKVRAQQDMTVAVQTDLDRVRADLARAAVDATVMVEEVRHVERALVSAAANHSRSVKMRGNENAHRDDVGPSAHWARANKLALEIGKHSDDDIVHALDLAGKIETVFRHERSSFLCQRLVLDVRNRIMEHWGPELSMQIKIEGNLTRESMRLVRKLISRERVRKDGKVIYWPIKLWGHAEREEFDVYLCDMAPEHSVEHHRERMTEEWQIHKLTYTPSGDGGGATDFDATFRDARRLGLAKGTITSSSGSTPEEPMDAAAQGDAKKLHTFGPQQHATQGSIALIDHSIGGHQDLTTRVINVAYCHPEGYAETVDHLALWRETLIERLDEGVRDGHPGVVKVDDGEGGHFYVRIILGGDLIWLRMVLGMQAHGNFVNMWFACFCNIHDVNQATYYPADFRDWAVEDLRLWLQTPLKDKGAGCNLLNELDRAILTKTHHEHYPYGTPCFCCKRTFRNREEMEAYTTWLNDPTNPSTAIHPERGQTSAGREDEDSDEEEEIDDDGASRMPVKELLKALKKRMKKYALLHGGHMPGRDGVYGHTAAIRVCIDAMHAIALNLGKGLVEWSIIRELLTEQGVAWLMEVCRRRQAFMRKKYPGENTSGGKVPVQFPLNAQGLFKILEQLEAFLDDIEDVMEKDRAHYKQMQLDASAGAGAQGKRPAARNSLASARFSLDGLSIARGDGASAADDAGAARGAIGRSDASEACSTDSKRNARRTAFFALRDLLDAFKRDVKGSTKAEREKAVAEKALAIFKAGAKFHIAYLEFNKSNQWYAHLVAVSLPNAMLRGLGDPWPHAAFANENLNQRLGKAFRRSSKGDATRSNPGGHGVHHAKGYTEQAVEQVTMRQHLDASQARSSGVPSGEKVRAPRASRTHEIRHRAAAARPRRPST